MAQKIEPRYTDALGRPCFLSSIEAFRYLEQEGFIDTCSGSRYPWTYGVVDADVRFRQDRDGRDEFYVEFRA